MRYLYFVFVLFVVVSCKTSFDATTGWSVNDHKNGGFEAVPFYDQETAPGMVLVKGGRLTIEQSKGKIDSLSLASFYISKYEESNKQYHAYLNEVKKYLSLIHI